MGLFKSRPSAKTKRGALKAIKGIVPSLTHFPKGCRFHPRCPFAMPKCRDGDVPDFLIEKHHHAKCWLHDGSEESAKVARAAMTESILEVKGLKKYFPVTAGIFRHQVASVKAVDGIDFNIYPGKF